jgi:dolichol-phosphate mannosyltransferase
MPDTVQLSLVVPCFNEQEALPHLLEALLPVLEREVGPCWELILVDDGSSDRTFETIVQANLKDPRVKGVSLSRNFGHQPAVSCGLAFASGEAVGLMDSDLQDSPEVLAQLYHKVHDEGYDIAYAVREKRDASLLKKFLYRNFYRLMRGVSEHPWSEDAGDFSVFHRRVNQTILGMPEAVRVLRGLRSWVGFKQCAVPVARPGRKHGTTKYSLVRLFSLGLSSITGFSFVPLRLASIIGLGMAALSLLLGVLFVLNFLFPKFTLLNYWIGARPGTTTVVVALMAVSSMLFLCLGILGEYLIVMLKELKRRPTAIARSVIGDLKPNASVNILSVPELEASAGTRAGKARQ